MYLTYMKYSIQIELIDPSPNRTENFNDNNLHVERNFLERNYFNNLHVRGRMQPVNENQDEAS